MSKPKKDLRKLNGVLLLDKPVGISSSKAALIVKAILKAKKAGHTGSLDVLASGLLPVCLGEATKFSQVLLDADKRYLTVAKLGERTTTCDAEGEVTATASTEEITKQLVQQVLQQFTGEIEQVPSMYSALKHNGQPLYKLARRGIEVERKKRRITIYEIKLLNYSQTEITLEVHCSKGTYIRNLVDDIGQALGCGAYVKSLRRIATGSFQLEQAVSLETLQQLADQNQLAQLERYLLPVDSLLSAYPIVNLTEEQAKSLQMGQKVLLNSIAPEGFVRAYYQQQFLGLAYNENNVLIAKRLCNYSPHESS